MCLAVPGKVISIDKKTNNAVIEYGETTKRSANISLVDAKIGDYVLVHAGFAIQKLDPKEAQETLEIFRSMLSVGDE